MLLQQLPRNEQAPHTDDHHLVRTCREHLHCKQRTRSKGMILECILLQVQDMTHVFNRADKFNGDVGDWQTGKVTNIAGMFAEAIEFDRSLELWDMSQVTKTIGRCPIN